MTEKGNETKRVVTLRKSVLGLIILILLVISLGGVQLKRYEDEHKDDFEDELLIN